MLIWLFAPPFQDFCAKDYGSWERMVSMNILGYLFTIGEFLPEMRARGSGHLVNISSDSERAAWPGEAAGHVSTPSFPCTRVHCLHWNQVLLGRSFGGSEEGADWKRGGSW